MPDDLDRLPPQDLEAEQAVLGAALLGGSVYLDVERTGLRPEDFYRDAHRHIFDAIAAVSSSHDDAAVDLVLVASRLRDADHLDACGGFEYLERLVRATPYSINAKQYAAVVLEKARRRRLLFLSQDLARKCYDLETSVDEVSTWAIDEIGTREIHTAVDPESLSIRAALADWRIGSHVADQVIATHIPTFDMALGGGFYQGNTHLIRGATGKGKSSFAIQLCSAAIDQGIRVGYVAGELTRGRVAGHLISLRSGVPQKALRRGLKHVRVPDYRRRAELEAERLHESDLFDLVGVQEFGGDMDEARGYLMAMADRGAQMVVVDNFTNVQAKADAFFDRYDKVGKMLHRFATHDFVKPVLVLTQQSTRGDGKGQTYGSSALDHDSALIYDIVFDKATNTGKGTIEKGRYDELASMLFECDPTTYRWIEVDENRREVPPWHPDDYHDHRLPYRDDPHDDHEEDPFARP